MTGVLYPSFSFWALHDNVHAKPRLQSPPPHRAPRTLPPPLLQHHSRLRKPFLLHHARWLWRRDARPPERRLRIWMGGGLCYETGNMRDVFTLRKADLITTGAHGEVARHDIAYVQTIVSFSSRVIHPPYISSRSILCPQLF